MDGFEVSMQHINRYIPELVSKESSKTHTHTYCLEDVRIDYKTRQALILLNMTICFIGKAKSNCAVYTHRGKWETNSNTALVQSNPSKQKKHDLALYRHICLPEVFDNSPANALFLCKQNHAPLLLSFFFCLFFSFSLSIFKVRFLRD